MSYSSATDATYAIGFTTALAALLLGLPACIKYFPDDPLIVRERVIGFRPDYLPPDRTRTLTLVPGGLERADTLTNLDRFTVRLTRSEGLTVFLSSGPQNGSRSTLLVPGVTRFLGQGGDTLRVDSFGDSLTILFVAIDSFELISRVTDVLVVDPYAILRSERFEVPLEVERTYDDGFFVECYDPSRGNVTGWTATELLRPQCLL